MCRPQGTSENECVLCESITGQAGNAEAAKDRILQSNCTIAMSSGGGGFRLFARESLPTEFLLFLPVKGCDQQHTPGGGVGG